MFYQKLTCFLALTLCLSCGNNTKGTTQQQETRHENKEKEYFVETNIKELRGERTPLVDSTNFDNFSFTNKLNIKQINELKLNETFNGISNFYVNYKIDMSDNFISMVISYEKGEHELFTVLINYDRSGKIIDTLHIAYDEIAESLSRKISTISPDKIVIENFNYTEQDIISKRIIYKVDTEGRFQTLT